MNYRRVIHQQSPWTRVRGDAGTADLLSRNPGFGSRFCFPERMISSFFEECCGDPREEFTKILIFLLTFLYGLV